MDEVRQGKEHRKDEAVHRVEISAANPGNPIFTSDKELVSSVSTAIDDPRTLEPYCKKQHSMYTTSSGDYGNRQPSAATTPVDFCGKSQRFSEHLGLAGMYRNNSLNTSSDQSRV